MAENTLRASAVKPYPEISFIPAKRINFYDPQLLPMYL